MEQSDFDTERIRAYLRFLLADGVGRGTISQLVEMCGDILSAQQAGPEVWKRIEGVGPKRLAAMSEVTEAMIDEELEIAAAAGARILCLEDVEYPAGLKTIHDPPPVLYVQGRLEPQDATALGVVGSRRATHYGLDQARRFGGLLGRAGFTVISGGARGVDTAAHRGAMAAGGRTLAVMGCGLSEVFPPENADLFKEILARDCGALISELPMRTAVLAGNFPPRNRIISGMSLGVLVVEATLPSGALITAREAVEQGREVFAVPGPVDSATSAGTNQLLRESAAHLAGDLDDILNGLGDVGRNIRAVEEELTPDAPTGLNETQQTLYDALAAEPRTLDTLTAETGVPTGQAAAAMTLLALKGLIEQRPGNLFARKR